MGAEGTQRWHGRRSKVVPKAPKGGAKGTAPPEGEGNPAEGGCFVSLIKYHNVIR